MDKTPLVEKDDLEVEGLVVDALSRAQIPVTAVDWVWVPQFEASQLVVVTSLYDSKGPRETYTRILEALHLAGVYQSVPIKELFVMSPQDPLAHELVRQLKLITEGNLHLSKISQNGRTEYSVVFTPYLGEGRAIPSVRFRDEQELREFLKKRLAIFSSTVDEACNRLRQTGSTSIFNVRLSLRKAKKLNLAA
jgi:hypothetical protein